MNIFKQHLDFLLLFQKFNAEDNSSELATAAQFSLVLPTRVLPSIIYALAIFSRLIQNGISALITLEIFYTQWSQFRQYFYIYHNHYSKSL